MSKEMEILSDIADQNDLHANVKTRRSTCKVMPFAHGSLREIFAGAKTGQLRRKVKVTLATCVGKDEGARG